MMTACERIGIGGGCGDNCFIFQEGECKTPFEVENIDWYPEDFEEAMQNYKDEKAARILKVNKTNQVKVGNMHTPIKISEEFIAGLLIDYYKGDNSLTNPMKLFIENEAFSQDIILMVDSALKKKAHHDIFDMDLFLNGYKDIISYIDSIPFTIKNIMANDFRGLDQATINAMIQNFYDADLTMSHFEFININFDILFSQKALDKQYKTSKAIVMHKDFDNDLKKEIYEETGDTEFLAKEIQEAFLF